MAGRFSTTRDDCSIERCGLCVVDGNDMDYSEIAGKNYRSADAFSRTAVRSIEVFLANRDRGYSRCLEVILAP